MRLTLAATLALLSAFMAHPISAADQNCPPPPKLTCDQLRARLVSRKCSVEPLCKDVGGVASNPQPAPGTPKAAPCPPTVETRYVVADDGQAAPRGSWLAGGGAIYQAGWGLAGVVGYEWSNGLQLQVGPNYVPHDGKHGSVTAHFGDGDDDDLGTVRYAAPAPSDWGASALLIYHFRK